MNRRGRLRRVTRTVALVLLAGVGIAAAGPAAASPSGTTTTRPPSSVRTAAADGHKVVLIGVTGLRFDDLDARATPTLWSLTRDGSVGSVVVRSVHATACPADGWLAVSAGTRAADLPAADLPAADLSGDGTCRTLQVPGTDATVPGWGDYLTAAADSGYDARLGLLGDSLATAGVHAAGIGPGAAIALARSSGRVTSPIDAVPADATDLSDLVRTDLGIAELLVVDLGTVRDPGPGSAGTAPVAARPAQVAALDTRVHAVLAGVPDGTTVVLASIADSGRQPHLQLAVATGPGVVPGGAAFGGGWLASTSTRQPGLLQTTDLTPTLLSGVGAQDAAPAGVLVGSPVTAGRGPTRAEARIEALVDQDRHAQATSRTSEPFYVGFVLLNLVLGLAVVIGLDGRLRWRRRATADVTSGPSPRAHVPGRVLVAVRVAGATVAAVPAASFLANASPWWRATSPAVVLLGLTAGWVAVIAGLALIPPWRRWGFGPAGVVAAATALVLGDDVATGATLQLSAPMGVQPLLGARFYGFSNTAFALFAAAVVIVAAAGANALVRRGRRRLAVAFVAAVGLGATVLDGLPGLGSDLGGPPGLVPGFAVLALLAAGVRLTWRRVLVVLGGGAGAVAFFAVLDWLRPADSRTHLGRFVQTLIDGGAWPVVQRKATQNLHTLAGSALSLTATVALVLALVALIRTVRRAAQTSDGGAYAWLSGGASLRLLRADAPMAGPAVITLGVVLGIAFLVNDSGIVIPAVGLGVAFPLLIATTANGVLHLRAIPAAERDPQPSA